MTLDDVRDPKLHPTPFLAVPQPEPQDAEADQDIFLMPAPPPPAWPRVFPSL